MRKTIHKLVKHGSTSLTISLPIAWRKKYNLNKGDYVTLEEKEDGKLIIDTEINMNNNSAHKKLEEQISILEKEKLYLMKLRYEGNVDKLSNDFIEMITLLRKEKYEVEANRIIQHKYNCIINDIKNLEEE